MKVVRPHQLVLYETPPLPRSSSSSAGHMTAIILLARPQLGSLSVHLPLCIDQAEGHHVWWMTLPEERDHWSSPPAVFGPQIQSEKVKQGHKSPLLYFILFYFISLRLGHTSIQNSKNDTDHTSTSAFVRFYWELDIDYNSTLQTFMEVTLNICSQSEVMSVCI